MVKDGGITHTHTHRERQYSESCIVC